MKIASLNSVRVFTVSYSNNSVPIVYPDGKHVLNKASKLDHRQNMCTLLKQSTEKAKKAKKRKKEEN
jgi:hypothetical protein